MNHEKTRLLLSNLAKALISTERWGDLETHKQVLQNAIDEIDVAIEMNKFINKAKSQ